MTNKKLHQNAAKRPKINGCCVWNIEHNFRSPIVSALDIVVYLFIFKASTPQISKLNACLVLLSEENIFRFDIAMDDFI